MDGRGGHEPTTFRTAAEVEPEDLQVGWHGDPFGRYAMRWWDGADWSEKIRDPKGAGIDPPGIDPAPVAIANSVPAAPIEDAVLPIPRPRVADTLALAFGCIVFLALTAVLVFALTS